MTLFRAPGIAIAEMRFMLNDDSPADSVDGMTDADRSALVAGQLAAPGELPAALNGTGGGARPYAGDRMDRW